MLMYDIPAYAPGADKTGEPQASFGPRCIIDKYVETTHPVEAAFWGVYRTLPDGRSEHVGDALDRISAEAFAELVAKSSSRRLSPIEARLKSLVAQMKSHESGGSAFQNGVCAGYAEAADAINAIITEQRNV